MWIRNFFNQFGKTKEKNENLKYLKRVIDDAYAYIEFDPSGKIIYANDIFLTLMEYQLSEIEGRHHKIFCEKNYVISDEYGQFWNDLSQGKIAKGEFNRITKSGRSVWLNASYTPVLDKRGELCKILKVASDITKMVEIRERATWIENAVDTGWSMIEFDKNGIVLDVNRNFLNVFHFENKNDVIGKHHKIFCSKELVISKDYEEHWNDLSSGKLKKGEFKRLASTGDEIWLYASYTPVSDDKGNVIKVIKIASNITSAIADKEKLNLFMKNSVIASSSEIAEGSNVTSSKIEEMGSNLEKFSSAISHIGAGAQNQSEQIGEISHTLDSVKSSANQVSSMAVLIKKVSEIAKEDAQRGSVTVNSVVESVDAIHKSAKKTNESTHTLANMSEEIKRIVSVITDLAAQTKLLSLNAGIEAAKAGKAGSGFAVVAKKIRELAEESKKSAEDIEGLIKNVINEINHVVDSVSQMHENVLSGSVAADEVREAFNKIDSSISDAFKKSTEIELSVKTQNNFIDSAIVSIEKIAVVSEETFAGTEELVTSSKTLHGGFDNISIVSKKLKKIANELFEVISNV